MIKKLLLSTSVLLTLAAGDVFAQNIKGGFETWSSLIGEPESPTGWVTPNIFAAPASGGSPQSAYKVTDKTEGNYALRLVTVALKTNPLKGKIADTVGFVISGSISTSLVFKDRTPFSGRPAQLDFSTKYTPNGVDTALALVQLSRWNGTSRETIAAGAIKWGVTANYTLKSVPLIYFSTTAIPDSASVILSASSPILPKIGSELYLDDVKFSGSVGVKEKEYLAAKVSVYPNPAVEFLTIKADIATAEKVSIYSQIGKQIGVYTLTNNTLKLNTSTLAAGNYYYSILEKSGNVIVGGVFSVVK